MAHMLSDLKGVVVYLDDICIFGTMQAEHDTNLNCVLEHLESKNLGLNQDKCTFNVSLLKFLGHEVSH